MAINQESVLGVRVDPKGAILGSQKASKAISGIGRTARGAKKAIFSLKGALVGLGAGMVIKSALNYASSLEGLQVRLKFITGSAHKAGIAFKTMTKFAAEAPFALKDIQKASPLLLTVEKDVGKLNALLEMTGDIAVVSGLDFVKTAEQLQRAMASGMASADLFRERGVASFLGFEAGVKVSAEETKKRLNAMWNDATTNAVGATKQFAQTFDGQVSMMGDAWDALSLAFMKEGVFGEVKGDVVELTAFLKDPETLEAAKALGGAIKDIIIGIGDTVKFIRRGVKGFEMRELNGLRDKQDVQIKQLQSLIAKTDALTDSEKKRMRNIRLRINLLGEQMHAESVKLGMTSVEWTGNRYSGMTDAETAEQKRLDALGVKADKILESARIVRKYKDAVKGVGIELTKTQQLQQAFQIEKDKISDMYKEHTDLAGDEKMAIQSLQEAFDKAISNMKANEIGKELKKMAEDIEGAIMGAFDSLITGAGDVKETIRGLMKDILMHFFKLNVLRPLLNSIGMGVGSSGNLGWAGSANSLSDNLATTIPGRAHGGSVTGNKPYIVGEQGSELFIPRGNGHIAPNSQLNASTGEVRNVNAEITFNVQAIDAVSFNAYLVGHKDTIESIINSSLMSNGSVRQTISQVV